MAIGPERSDDAGWLTIRVTLLGGAGEDLDPPPGRDLLVGPHHTFALLAEAIDQAFARWDVSHLHLFELQDGRRLVSPWFEDRGSALIDSKTRVADLVGDGAAFTYVFDLGDEWTHRCEVLEAGIDVQERYGAPPKRPAPVWGWGWIPDQYGRLTPEGED